jgi:hypothetical protein
VIQLFPFFPRERAIPFQKSSPSSTGKTIDEMDWKTILRERTPENAVRNEKSGKSNSLMK